MTEVEERACLELENSCEFRNDSDIDRYADAARQLRGGTDPAVLRRMLRCVRDADAGEVQYELVEACESFPLETYVSVFLEEAPEIARQSSEWFELMFQSILNGDQHRNAAIGKMRSLDPERRRFFAELLAKLASHTPKYQSVLESLRG